MLSALGEGLSAVTDPWVLAIIVASALVGVVVGALPGLSSPMAVALLLPLTLGLDPVPALASMAALYCGGTFGGSITAILVNTPGAPPAAATALDGYAMTLKGEGSRALGIAVISSVFGGVFGLVAFVLFAPGLAAIAATFRPMELFALSIFALSMLASVAGESRVRNLISGVVGLLLGTVGVHLTTGVTRFDFGRPELEDGVGLVPIVIGFFAIAELLRQAGKSRVERVIADGIGGARPWRDALEFRWTLLRSSAIGVFVGVLPAEGSTIAALLGYNQAKRWSRRGEEFGKGCPEGVAAPEAANNAATGGALVPTLALGIPGSSTTAVMLVGLGIHGVRPGPRILEQAPATVYGIVLAMLIANLAILAIGLLGAPALARIATIPRALLWPAVFSLAVVGAYAPGGSVFDVWLMLLAGIFGYFAQQRGFAAMPLVMGLVLSAPIEEAFSQSMLILDNEYWRLLESPTVVVLFALTALQLSWRPVSTWLRSRSGSSLT